MISPESPITSAFSARAALWVENGGVYDDIIGTFTRNGVVDDETQRNDLNIIRQVTNTNETMPNARGYDFSFALEADQQLNKIGWKP